MDDSKLNGLLSQMRDQSEVEAGSGMVDGILSKLGRVREIFPTRLLIVVGLSLVLVSISIGYRVGVTHERSGGGEELDSATPPAMPSFNINRPFGPR